MLLIGEDDDLFMPLMWLCLVRKSDGRWGPKNAATTVIPKEVVNPEDGYRELNSNLWC